MTNANPFTAPIDITVTVYFKNPPLDANNEEGAIMQERNISKSYRKCSCGSDCDALYRATQAKPCWGSVYAVDEVELGDYDYYWVHMCEGHASEYDDSGYKAEGKDE